MRVYICNYADPSLGASVVYLPLIYGVLRSFAETDEVVGRAVTFGPPLWPTACAEEVLERLEAPDLVAFSVYVWNERNTHRLAAALKARYPECLVVLGGPQIPNRPSDYLERHPWVDLLVHGEGELPFRDVLRQLCSGNPDWNQVAGVSFRSPQGQQFSSPATRLSELDYPSPYLAGYFDPLIEQLRGLQPRVTLMMSMETNRGCPYSCSFCDWGMATMSRLRRFSEQRVRAEFAWAADRGVDGVVLNDANFGILPRDVALAEYLAELKAEHGAPRYFYPLGLAKNNKDRAFAINKLIIDHQLDPFEMNVNFSLQATSQTTLDAICRQNIQLENYRILADRYSQEGYQLTPDLILPLPGETLESFCEGYADLVSWPQVRRVRVYPCGVLPNAPMADPDYRRQWGLVTRELPLGRPSEDPRIETEVIETVVATSTMSEAEVLDAKLFVGLVNALDLFGLTRDLRRYAQRAGGISPYRFYAGFRRYQVGRAGTLATSVTEFSELSAYNDELVSSGRSHTHDGKLLPHHKAVAYDALTRADRFRAELAGYFAELGLELPEEMLRYQADQWILPDYDPGRDYTAAYAWDWAAYLRGEPLTRRAWQADYRPRQSWLRYGYRPGLRSWRAFALNVDGPDTFCLQTSEPEA